MTTPPSLGVLVPCRDEAAVLPRKLRNLARLRWPPGEHRLLVVDDGSSDGTADLARALGDELFGEGRGLPRLEVVANDVRPGKAGAIAAGLAVLGADGSSDDATAHGAHAPDLVLLTDADVVFREEALVAVARAFADDARLGMACGSQEFVEDLADDGTPGAADGGPPRPAAGLYDRLTARVRALESRGGRLFSIHGQLLAWRASLGIRPTPGIAADDLDLMRQVRAAGLAVRKLDDARFLEVKTPAGPRRRDQELRRARAYVQVIGRCRLPADAPRLDRAHFAAYRTLPLAAPWIAVAGAAAFLAVVVPRLPHPAALVALVVGAAVVVSPAGRRAARLLGVIATATRLERAGTLDDRWDMRRTDAGAAP